MNKSSNSIWKTDKTRAVTKKWRMPPKRFCEGLRFTLDRNKMEETVETQTQQTMSVAWQQHEDLAASMGELYEKSLWTDVKFHCKNHEESVIVHAHKIVLAVRSPVFQAMFFGPCADGKEDIEFEHAEAEVLDLFLKFMYTDSTDLDEDTAPLVLKVAHYYQVNKLVQFCANYLATTLTTENACTIFSLSMLYQVTSLRDTCCSFIDKNAEEILLSEGFLELPEEFLVYIVKGDTFFAKEDAIFTTAEEWATRKLRQENLEKNGPNIRKALGEAFYYLRLPTMTTETLINCICRKGFFSVEEYEDIFKFINNIPTPSVQSNSSVQRIPTEETLLLNDEGGNTITADKISSSFQISVTRDLKLSYFTLAKVHQFFKYNNEFRFKKTGSDSINTNTKTLTDFISLYNGRTIKIESRPMLFGFCSTNRPTCINILEEIKSESLSNESDVAISGHVTITCHNAEKNKNLEQEHQDVHSVAAVDNDGSKAVDEIKLVEDDDDGAVDEIKLVLEQDFEVLSSKMSERIIDLKEHVILSEKASPYTFNLTLQYSCDSNVKMETKCSGTTGTITSVHGQLQVNDIVGGFAGIRSLGFENISRRETV